MRKLSFSFLTMLLLTSVAVADTLYLRDGRTLRGTLLGFINGRFAFKVSATQTGPSTAPVRPEEGEIQLIRPSEVDRIEIDGRSLDELRYESRNVEVQLSPNWIDSGIDLRSGERVQISASGIILVGRSRITPDGLRTTDPTSPLPRACSRLRGSSSARPCRSCAEWVSTLSRHGDRLSPRSTARKWRWATG